MPYDMKGPESETCGEAVGVAVAGFAGELPVVDAFAVVPVPSVPVAVFSVVASVAFLRPLLRPAYSEGAIESASPSCQRRKMTARRALSLPLQSAALVPLSGRLPVGC